MFIIMAKCKHCLHNECRCVTRLAVLDSGVRLDPKCAKYALGLFIYIFLLNQNFKMIQIFYTHRGMGN